MAKSKQELVQTAKRRLRRNYELLDKKAKRNLGEGTTSKATHEAEALRDRAEVETEIGLRRKK